MAENKGGSLRWNFTPISGLERAPTYNWYPWPGTVFRKKSINKFLLGPWKTQRKFRRKTETTATSYLVSFNFSPTENFFLSSTIWFLEPMVFITLSYGIGPNQEKSHASTSRWKVLVYSPPPPYLALHFAGQLAPQRLFSALERGKVMMRVENPSKVSVSTGISCFDRQFFGAKNP